MTEPSPARELPELKDIDLYNEWNPARNFWFSKMEIFGSQMDTGTLRFATLFAHHVTAKRNARIAELEKVTELIVPAHLEHAKELREKDAECSRLREEVERLTSLNQDFATKWQTAEHDNCQLTYALEQSETAFSNAERRAEALADENSELKATIAASLRKSLEG